MQIICGNNVGSIDPFIIDISLNMFSLIIGQTINGIY